MEKFKEYAIYWKIHRLMSDVCFNEQSNLSMKPFEAFSVNPVNSQDTWNLQLPIGHRKNVKKVAKYLTTMYSSAIVGIFATCKSHIAD